MKHIDAMKKAKIAVAGVALMSDVIDQIAARRSDIVEDVLEKVLGVKHDAGDEAFNAAMAKRAEKVTTFDEYEDRVAALETVVRDLLKYHAYESGKDNEADMSLAVGRANKVLKQC